MFQWNVIHSASKGFIHSTFINRILCLHSFLIKRYSLIKYLQKYFFFAHLELWQRECSPKKKRKTYFHILQTAVQQVPETTNIKCHIDRMSNIAYNACRSNVYTNVTLTLNYCIDKINRLKTSISTVIMASTGFL